MDIKKIGPISITRNRGIRWTNIELGGLKITIQIAPSILDGLFINITYAYVKDRQTKKEVGNE